MKNSALFLGFPLLLMVAATAKQPNPELPNGWKVHDMERPLPPLVQAGKSDSKAPSDAIVLFDGSDFSEWIASAKHNPDGKIRWKLEDGHMEVTPTGGITTKRKFGDMQLHLEWATPNPPTEEAQRRGNSGIYLMGRYEIQIMDGHENNAYADGMAGAVYGQTPALVNVCKKPGEWQSYDIIFKAPVFKEGKLVSPAIVTVFQNGVLVQNHTEILGSTQHNKLPFYKPHPEKLPFFLQNHGHPVRFRNIWVREL